MVWVLDPERSVAHARAWVHATHCQSPVYIWGLVSDRTCGLEEAELAGQLVLEPPSPRSVALLLSAAVVRWLTSDLQDGECAPRARLEPPAESLPRRSRPDPARIWAIPAERFGDARVFPPSTGPQAGFWTPPRRPVRGRRDARSCGRGTQTGPRPLIFVCTRVPGDFVACAASEVASPDPSSGDSIPPRTAMPAFFQDPQPPSTEPPLTSALSLPLVSGSCPGH